jgi:hypothetical protein
VSGALAGLSTDVLSGGLTLGGGMIAGGVLGALGAAGIAEGVNRIRGTDRSWVAWKGDALMPMVDAALLRYLAVAHFGRGRGRWADAAAPEHWAAAVHGAVEPHRERLADLWRGIEGQEVGAAAIEATRRGLQPVLAAAARDTLLRLYPDAQAALPAGAGAGGEIDQAGGPATP